MSRVLAFAVALLCGATAAWSQEISSASKPLLIENVSLIPMDREVVLEQRAVLIVDGRIEQIAAAGEIAPPEGCVAIDGSGAFLMPGVADMHVHCWSEDDLKLYAANGVLAIRNMWGTPIQLAWQRRNREEPDWLAPAVYTSSPILDGPKPVWPTSRAVLDPEAAKELVPSLSGRGYRALKVYNGLGKETYLALVESARSHEMAVWGHIPDAVGLETALEAKQDSIEHLSGYLMAAQGEDAPARKEPGVQASSDHVDAGRVEALVAKTVRAGTWNCPTLIVLDHIANLDRNIEAWESRPEMAFVSPAMRESWDPKRDFRFQSASSERYDRMRANALFYKGLASKLHEAGAPLLLGTDAPNPYVVPGFSIHDELARLVAAGLSPYEALRAGTAGAAKFLGEEEQFGTIAVGRRADLVLLNENPLEDVASFQKRRGIILRGTWYTESALQERLAAIAEKYAK
ncbi:MAG: amidohydrolase family protein [Planctomycetota bacterium]